MFNIAFFGSAGPFSQAVLNALLGAGLPVRTLVCDLPGKRSHFASHHGPDVRPTRAAIPVAQTHKLVDIARSAGCSPTLIGFRDAKAREALAASKPDVGIAACFAPILPAPWLSLPRHGIINLHPSALPAYRGPDPLFWQFRAGEQRMAVTAHLMTPVIDGGDILGRLSAPLAAGVTEGDLEQQLATQGAVLLIDAIGDLMQARALSRAPQGTQGASYQRAPRPDDYSLNVAWSAERAHRFICGTRARGLPYRIAVAGQDVLVTRSLGVVMAKPQTNALVLDDGRISIPFADGTLLASGKVAP